MPHTCYIANGLCHEPTADDPRRGQSEMRFFNPCDAQTSVRMTVYYTDRPPTDLPALHLPPKANPYWALPEKYPDAFTDCGPWGMRLVSDQFIMVDHILIAGVKGRTEDIRYAGGVADVLARPDLSHHWLFGDGLLLKLNPDGPAHQPHSQFEWYHLLNPSAADAAVTMTCYYGDGSRDQFQYTIPAERVLLIDNHNLIKPNNAFGLVFVSTQPIVAEGTRLIRGHRSLDEWGAQIHTPRPGIPAPLEWVQE